MQSLEGVCEEGEHTIKKLKTCRSSLPLLQHQQPVETFENCTASQSFCIFKKFLELLQEDSTEKRKGLRKNSHILEKLVARERLNTLILNLHAGNKGYSLAFRTYSRKNQVLDDTANMIETKEWPYEEEKLLRYIDDEELPPYLTELLETHYSFLFYNGCVIAEVRDYRVFYPKIKCDIHHVLLRPTLKSLLADINNLVDDKLDFGSEERQQMESQLLVANNPTLCLTPDSSISTHLSRLNHNRQMWTTHRYRHAAHNVSQVAANRKRKLDQFMHRSGLNLYDFLCRMKNDGKRARNRNVPVIPVPNLEPPPIAGPSQGVFINEFKTYQRPQETSDCLPQLIEEYVLETNMPSKEKGKQRVYHIKLSILQRPSNSEYLGELYLDRDHKKNERNGVACRFSLGSRANANRYIHQFTEIFTESGRKSVRIWYGLSSGYKQRVAMAQAQAQDQSATQTTLPQQHLTLGQGLQNESTSLVNGTVGPRISLVQPNQSIQNTPNVPILQGHLSTPSQMMTSPQVSTQEREISALANELENIGEQYEQQQQKLSASRANAVIKNLLNSSPVNNINDTSATVLNQRTNSLLPQTLNQKPLVRKMIFSNVTNARVLNNSNLIAVNNNNRMNLSDLTSQQPQTITLTSVNSGSYSGVPIKQQILGSGESNKALQALLVGTPAADRPDIVGSNTNSLLLEKLSSTTPTPTSPTAPYIQSFKSGTVQYMVQSPSKANTVVSPLSSPPPQTPNTTINLAQLQSLSGMSNVQGQLPVFAQSISLSGSLLVSMPVTSTSTNTVTQSSGVGGQTVVLTNAGNSNIVQAQLVTSGVKGLGPSIRAQGATSVLSQGQSYQLVTPLQRPRLQQQNTQRTPITLKMATQNSTSAQASISQLQKQAQYPQYQQLCMSPQNNMNVGGKLRRRSNASDTQ